MPWLGVAVKNSKVSPGVSSIGSATFPVRISGPFTSIITATCRPISQEISRIGADQRSIDPLPGGVRLHIQADHIHPAHDQRRPLAALGGWATAVAMILVTMPVVSGHVRFLANGQQNWGLNKIRFQFEQKECRDNVMPRDEQEPMHRVGEGPRMQRATLLGFRPGTTQDAETLAALQTAVAEHLTRTHGQGPWSRCDIGEGRPLRDARFGMTSSPARDSRIVATWRLAAKNPGRSTPITSQSAVSRSICPAMAVLPDKQLPRHRQTMPQGKQRKIAHLARGHDSP